MRKVFPFLLWFFLIWVAIPSSWGQRKAPKTGDEVKAYTYAIKAQMLRMEGASPRKLIPMYREIIKVLPSPRAYIDYAHALLQEGNLRKPSMS